MLVFLVTLRQTKVCGGPTPASISSGDQSEEELVEAVGAVDFSTDVDVEVAAGDFASAFFSEPPLVASVVGLDSVLGALLPAEL